MSRDHGMYTEEIVWEFYASYAATLWGSIYKKANPKTQDPLRSTMFRGVRVIITYTTISQFLYAPNPDNSWAANTTDFDYQ